MSEILAAKRGNSQVSSKMAKSFKGKESSKVKSVPTPCAHLRCASAAWLRVFSAPKWRQGAIHACTEPVEVPAWLSSLSRHTRPYGITQTVGTPLA